MSRGAPRVRASKSAPSSPMQRSSSRRKAAQAAGSRPASPPVEGDQHMRHIDGAPPGDVVRGAREARPSADLAGQKSRRIFFEDAFSVNNPPSPARERVRGDAIVLAEVKTNVRDEFAFIADLACQLSARYQRPVSSVVVTLHHGACLLFGGSFDPAYAMAVRALPSQLQPTTNKRNAALLQRHMEEALGVAPSRGVLRFVPIPEEHLACGGKTVAGEIEEMEVGGGYCHVGIGQSGSRGSGGSGGSGGSFFGAAGWSVRSMAAHELTPPGSADGEPPSMPGSYSRTAPKIEQVDSGKKAAQRRKSFVATIFGRSGSKSSDRSSLPAIADDDADA
ncbi:Tautomerase/MIF superfamily [Thermothelomyces heterothallicus CBS 202.75]|uniref:Tautomerase/MIF superfamily n=1 Tax=Thermothelomyces heterothallicus CBS 202.75 TaxID=1149848 RepID=UPI003743E866